MQITACVVEAIWRYRKDLIFNGKAPSTPTTLTQIALRAAEFQEIHSSNGDVPHPASENLIMNPTHVSSDTSFDACFLVDASAVDDAAGIGVVLNRSGGGETITIQSQCLVSSVLEAKLVAILTALERAWEDQYHSMLIESNSKVAIEALRLGELPLAWECTDNFH
ncbi:hypothetical protein G4B88_027921 [Cannabis sativa]|uniref:RNase H type-1 domain-containing protein n=1 Tax=Cannabis sativa TaxID=3483 RepID=A0A7J6I905_CANSA|nr:hypothetical protein G4B88_027921 [Cannabis sativa]